MTPAPPAAASTARVEAPRLIQIPCGFEIDDTGASRCVDDPREGETFTGRCDRATAVWREGGEAKRRECASCDVDMDMDMGCGWVDGLGGYDCVAP